MKSTFSFFLAFALLIAGGILGCDKNRSYEKASQPAIGSALQSLSACLQIYASRHNGELPDNLDDLKAVAGELHVSEVIKFPRQYYSYGDWIYFALPRKLAERPTNDLLVALPFPLYNTDHGISVERKESDASQAFRYCINSSWEVVKIDEEVFSKSPRAKPKE